MILITYGTLELFNSRASNYYIDLSLVMEQERRTNMNTLKWSR